MSVRIITGDALTELAKLPAESVHCCVTSPPYYGLRDYGTASWDGGDPACEHINGRPGSDRADGIVGLVAHRNRDGAGAFSGDCRKCGARRLDAQLGLEATPDAYVAAMVGVFREVRRVLRSDGTLWLNIGDSYAGSGKGGNPDSGKQATNAGSQSIGVLYGKDGDQQRQAAVTNVTRRTFRAGAGRADGIVDERAQRNRNGTGAAGGDIKAKDLIGIPWMLAFALRADGWWLRQDIIWAKPNPMPESVTDRCTKGHEYLFLLSKSAAYYYDAAAIAEPASYDPTNTKFPDGYPLRNKRSVWTIATAPYPEAHFATFPPALVEPCVMAGSPVGGSVLDPFSGAGTTAMVADRLGRSAVGIELNPAYALMARHRIEDDAGMFAAVAAD